MRISSLLSVPLSASALLLSASLFVSPAWADDAVAADEDDFFKTDDKPKPPDVPDASAFNSGDDDAISIAAPIKVEPPAAKVVAAPVGPSRLGLDLNGKSPLTDNWGPTVVFTTADAVVVELPVLYANNGTGFDGNAYWLVAEVYADGKKLGEQRVQVMKETVSAKGASVQFFRFFTPVAESTGVLEIKVAKLAAGSSKASLLFTRSVSYAL